MGLEGGRPGSPTQAVRHTCSGKLGIVKIFKIAPHKQKSTVKKNLTRRWALCLSTPKHNGKFDIEYQWPLERA